jgi:hypothetical protein
MHQHRSHATIFARHHRYGWGRNHFERSLESLSGWTVSWFSQAQGPLISVSHEFIGGYMKWTQSMHSNIEIPRCRSQIGCSSGTKPMAMCFVWAFWSSLLWVEIHHCKFVCYPCFGALRGNGVTFVAEPATTVLTSKWELKPGDIVTFKHRGFWLSNNKPKSPTIYRVRADKTWEDLVAAAQNNQVPSGNLYYFLLVSIIRCFLIDYQSNMFSWSNRS